MGDASPTETDIVHLPHPRDLGTAGCLCIPDAQSESLMSNHKLRVEGETRLPEESTRGNEGIRGFLGGVSLGKFVLLTRNAGEREKSSGTGMK